ncbi:hypothetical protein BCR44DRAFT_35018 [Catenaria anguillulae PL171]|uniref:trimethyllysine dioxygenase n=1 Tax=Catenaria anguillulae PL171 TaxID=765915 RepID=A0A1Y2HAM9_9FUNG|nr:hypothetical protein BCR44DRAFT_35018 [Catenaria anguillulae PL171]
MTMIRPAFRTLSRFFPTLASRTQLVAGATLHVQRTFPARPHDNFVTHHPSSGRLLHSSAAPPRSFSTVSIPLSATDPPTTLHAIWLRDHCRCAACWHPITKQRLVDTATLPRDISVTSVKVAGDAVHLTWSDGHTATFEKAWLAQHAYGEKARFRTELEAQPYDAVKLWGAEIKHAPPSVEYDAVMDPSSDDGLAQWLANIAQYGFSLVTNVPACSKKTRSLAERIAFIRETHYGTYWDFTPNLEHGDTAYTSLALPAHTDTTYFTDPIGLQLFHLLGFTGTGGESLLVDGFAVAAQLKAQDPQAYRVLRDTKIGAHCAGDEATYIYPHPRYGYSMFTEDAQGKLVTLRYNNNDRSVLNHLSSQEVEAYYDALLKWQALVKDKRNEYWFAAKPGLVWVLDNQRVMHGRAEFTGKDRRLTGCYLNGDDWRSRLRTVGKAVERRLC